MGFEYEVAQSLFLLNPKILVTGLFIDTFLHYKQLFFNIAMGLITSCISFLGFFYSILNIYIIFLALLHSLSLLCIFYTT